MDIFSLRILANRDFSSFYAISGVLGSVITYFYRSWNGVLEIFFISMFFDWITGIAASIKEGKGLSSSIGFLGGMKKFLMAFTVFFGHRIDLAFDFNWVMVGCIYFWLANELVSISENFARLGVNFPTPLKKIIAILQDKQETTIKTIEDKK